MAPQFRLRYAQEGAESINELRTPPQLAAAITAWHAGRNELHFIAEGTAVVDLVSADAGPRGIVARPYLATMTVDGETASKSGTDMLRISEGQIAEVWSVSASERPYYP